MEKGLSSEALLEEVEQSEGQQGWLATFADLMSLLMCFFVLLLSFSELDVIKFKQIAGSMKTAFGVQRDIVADDIPLGTSAVMQDFSPAIPKPTLLDDVRQTTQDESAYLAMQQTLTVNTNNPEQGLPTPASLPETDRLIRELQATLAKPLEAGAVELDRYGQQLIIRLSERGTFASGSAFLQPAFRPYLREIGQVLSTIPGRIVVSGHSDSAPLRNEMFEDNLALSSARAVAVARILKQSAELPYIQANGMADSEPLTSNRTSTGRAINRRVEIAIIQGEATQQTIHIGKGAHHG